MNFDVRLFGELLIRCEQCNAAPGETCTPPALDCACSTCAAILRRIAARTIRGCQGGRREEAGEIYEQDPHITPAELLDEAKRRSDRKNERWLAEFQVREARRVKMLATRARNAAAKLS